MSKGNNSGKELNIKTSWGHTVSVKTTKICKRAEVLGEGCQGRVDGGLL